MNPLLWPLECANPALPALNWSHADSNRCLDVHGDPQASEWALYSDGNHHMALEKSLQSFVKSKPGCHGVFYATLPPQVLIEAILQSGIRLGNLLLRRKPDIFIGPDTAMPTLRTIFPSIESVPFMQSRGNVLLVPAANVKNIKGIEDLLRKDVRIFISNPVTEKASFQVYRQSLIQIAQYECQQGSAMQTIIDTRQRMVFGERIHHRELPQILAHGLADVALVYYHLAKRYIDIFPGQFALIYLGQGPEHPGNVLTRYYINKLPDHSQNATDLWHYLQSSEVRDIYRDQGLQEYSV